MLSPKVKCAIQILSELEKAAGQGTRLSMKELRIRCRANGQLLSQTLLQLRCTGWIEGIGTKQVLVKDLIPSTLYELVRDMDGELSLGGISVYEGWSESFGEVCPPAVEMDRRLSEELEQRLQSVQLSDLFPCGRYGNDSYVRRRIDRKKINGQ